MYRHSVYLNMIYVDVNGPLTRFNWIVWAQIIYKKKTTTKNWCFWAFTHSLFLSLKSSVGNRFTASSFFYFSAPLSRFSSVSALSIPCLFKPLYFLGWYSCTENTTVLFSDTKRIPPFFSKGTAFDFSRFCALFIASDLSSRSRFCWFLSRIDGKTGVMDPFLKKEKKKKKVKGGKS